MALVLGALKGRGSTPNLNHTCREICVISLATFTVPVCRWIASEGNPAISFKALPAKHALRCGPAATGSAPDSELLAVLAAEAARVACKEAQTRKRSRVRSCAGADQSWGRMGKGPITTRVRIRAHAAAASLVCQHSPLRRAVLPPAEPSHRSQRFSAARSQRVSGLFKNGDGTS